MGVGAGAKHKLVDNMLCCPIYAAVEEEDAEKRDEGKGPQSALEGAKNERRKLFATPGKETRPEPVKEKGPHPMDKAMWEGAENELTFGKGGENSRYARLLLLFFLNDPRAALPVSATSCASSLAAHAKLMFAISAHMAFLVSRSSIVHVHLRGSDVRPRFMMMTGALRCCSSSTRRVATSIWQTSTWPSELQEAWSLPSYPLDDQNHHYHHHHHYDHHHHYQHHHHPSALTKYNHAMIQ